MPASTTVRPKTSEAFIQTVIDSSLVRSQGDPVTNTYSESVRSGAFSRRSSSPLYNCFNFSHHIGLQSFSLKAPWPRAPALPDFRSALFSSDEGVNSLICAQDGQASLATFAVRETTSN